MIDNLRINKRNIDMARVVLTLGDFYFYKLIVKFHGEKKFREVMRSLDADVCKKVMEDCFK